MLLGRTPSKLWVHVPLARAPASIHPATEGFTSKPLYFIVDVLVVLFRAEPPFGEPA